MEDRYLTIAGFNTRYWQAGDTGPVVVLVHGFAASVEYWMYNIEELEKLFRVYALDLVGFGRSDKPRVKYSAEFLSNFLRDFFHAMQIEKAHLIGHSLGGAICLQFTYDNPRLLENLVLVDSAGFGQELPQGLRILTLPFFGRFLLRFNQKQLYARAIGAYAYNRKAITSDFIDRMFAIFQLPGTKRAILSMLRQHANYFGIKKSSIKPLLRNLPKLQHKVLVIWGKNDRLFPLEHACRAQNRLPNVTVHIFPNCGHMPQIEVSAAFNSLVTAFLL